MTTSTTNKLMDNMGNENNSNEMELASQYALRVALQTMKERCISLQQRLTIVEEENSSLRNRHGQNGNNFSHENHDDDLSSNLKRQMVANIDNDDEKKELERLQKQVVELTQHKMQINEYIKMVSTENRQLWSRLSQLAKDKNQQSHEQEEETEGQNNLCQYRESYLKKSNANFNSNGSTGTAGETGNGQNNLIRSKTFTQHSPNPNLRQKYIPIVYSSEGDDGALNIGMGIDDDVAIDVNCMEEVPLKGLDPCEDLIPGDRGNSLGFGYLNDDGSDGDIGLEARKCIDGMLDIRKELLKQQSDLKVTLSTLKDKKMFHECEECKERRKTEMVDKNLETDEAFLGKTISNSQHQMEFSTNIKEQKLGEHHTITGLSNGIGNLNILEEKILADETDKMCPMCGQIFSSSIAFEQFLNHVQDHFSNELEEDNNFELVSNTIGNF